MNEIGNNLKRIRLLKNMSLKKAGEILNMTAPAISKYEHGDIIPDGNKLIEFADAYEVKASIFLESYNEPQMNFISFRKRKRLKGKKLELLKSIIQMEVAKNFEVLEMKNIEKRNIKLKKYSCNNIEDAEIAADKFRKFIQISKLQPLSNLINILENLGIIIIQIKDSNNNFTDFDGLSEVVNNIPVIVLLDGITDGARQRFTITHELAHLILDINDNQDEEKVCDRFASSLLMPKEAIINEFGKTRRNISFFELDAFKKEYKVSYSAIVYRLRDLNIISEYLFKNLNILINKYIGKKDPNPISPEVSIEFKKNVHRLEADNIISLKKACELLGVSTNEYNKENNSYRY